MKKLKHGYEPEDVNATLDRECIEIARQEAEDERRRLGREHPDFNEDEIDQFMVPTRSRKFLYRPNPEGAARHARRSQHIKAAIARR